MSAVLYLTRAAALPLLLLAGPGPGVVALGAFALLFGPTFIANQAPGARLVRDRYGLRAVGPLMGSVGLAHQVGGLAQLRIPRQTTLLTRESALSSPRHAGDS